MNNFPRIKRAQEPVEFNYRHKLPKAFNGARRPEEEPSTIPYQQQQTGESKYSSKNSSQEKASTPLGTVEVKNQSPFEGKQLFSELMQPSSVFIVRQSSHSDRELEMLKKMNESASGLNEFNLLKSLDHPNIVKIHNSYIYDNIFYLGLEYSRYTLEEVLAVPIPLRQEHLEIIISSVRHLF
jgi:hypothetical protein